VADNSPREPEPPLFGSTFTDVSADFTLGKRLGTGNFAKVVLGHVKKPMAHWRLAAGDGVAIKVVKKPASRRAVERVEMLRAEVQILRSIQHPNIVRLYDVYESPNRLYLVMELLTGGELFDRIVGLGKFSEDDARYFTFKMLNAVLYLHDRNICHRDLKPENILLASPEHDAELKITDFGLSKISSLPDDFLMTTRCGTPGYVAPEVLAQEVTRGQLRRYGTSCDCWSVGVIVYILLSAAPPFYGKTDAEMNRRIRQGQYKFPDKYWSHISQSAKDFISRLLTVDPTKRMTALEALQHDWVVSIGVHTNDLFAISKDTCGVPIMQARLHEFNLDRRATTRSQQQRKEILGLPEDEEELHSFRCLHADKTGHLVLTPGYFAFLAYDQSTMFSLPIAEVCTLRAARALTWAAASDNSLVLTMTNGGAVQFDGFWERDECMELLQACGRFLKHHLVVEHASDGDATLPAAAADVVPLAAASSPAVRPLQAAAEAAEAAAAAEAAEAAAAEAAAHANPAGAAAIAEAPAHAAVGPAEAMPAPGAVAAQQLHLSETIAPPPRASGPAEPHVGLPMPPPQPTLDKPPSGLDHGLAAAAAPASTYPPDLALAALRDGMEAMQTLDAPPTTVVKPLALGALEPMDNGGWVSPRSAGWGTPRKE